MMDWNRIKITGVTDCEKCLRKIWGYLSTIPINQANSEKGSLESTQDLCRSTYWTVFATLGSRPSTAGGRQYITWQLTRHFAQPKSGGMVSSICSNVYRLCISLEQWLAYPMLGNGIYVHSQGTSLEGCVSLVVKVNNVLHPLVN